VSWKTKQNTQTMKPNQKHNKPKKKNQKKKTKTQQAEANLFFSPSNCAPFFSRMRCCTMITDFPSHLFSFLIPGARFECLFSPSASDFLFVPPTCTAAQRFFSPFQAGGRQKFFCRLVFFLFFLVRSFMALDFVPFFFFLCAIHNKFGLCC